MLNAALAVSILGHVIMIIHDNYLLRRIINLIINAIGLAAVISLLTIFPFDFSVIPDSTIAAGVEVGVAVVLICVSIGMGIGLLVNLIKTPIAMVRGTM